MDLYWGCLTLLLLLSTSAWSSTDNVSNISTLQTSRSSTGSKHRQAALLLLGPAGTLVIINPGTRTWKAQVLSSVSRVQGPNQTLL